MKKILLSLCMSLVTLCAMAGTETFNFKDWAFNGASDWTTSYAQHVVTGSAYQVTFAAANKQSSTSEITDMPVTKGQPITVSSLSSSTITGVKIVLKQWGSKAQTVTLNVSSNGTDFEATDTKSSDFALEASGLSTKAVKFTFSNSSNQVGVESIEVTYSGGGTTLKDPSIAFSASTASVIEGDAFEAPTLSNPNNLAVSYSSSKETVATVSSTGDVTIVGPGETTITAAFAGNTTYFASSANYKLTVKDKTSTSIYVGSTTVTVEKGATTTNSATLKDVHGNEISGATLVWSVPEDYAAIVSVTEDGVIKGLAVGEGKVKVAYEGEEGVYKSSSKTFTVNVINPLSASSISDTYSMENKAAFELGAFDVVYVNGSYTYVKDATASGLIYKSSYGLNAGDHVAAGLKGTVSIYNGLYELVPTTAVTDLTVTAGTAPAPVEATSAPTAADVNKYVVYKGVKFADDLNTSSKTTIDDATFKGGNIIFYNQFAITIDVKAGEEYDVVAVNSIRVKDSVTTLQAYPISITSTASSINSVSLDAADAPAYNIAGQRVSNNYKGAVIKNGKKYIQK